MSNDSKRNSHANEDFAVHGSRVGSFEDALLRLETNLNEKMNSLFSRMDKCSDLAVASSRAIAALSNQFEEHKHEVDRKLHAQSSAMDDLRSSMNKLCSESQNLTMTALEDCCSQLVKQIKNNADSIVKCNESFSSTHASTASSLASTENELKAVRGALKDLSSQVAESQALEDDMRVVAEECVNAGLQELNAKFTHDLENFDLDWKEYRENVECRFHQLDQRFAASDKQTSRRLEDLKELFDDRMQSDKESSAAIVSKAKRETAGEIEELRRMVNSMPRSPDVSDTALRSISADVSNVQSIMQSFTASTLPALYREVELKIAHCEHHTQQQSLELLKEFATEMEFDIDRMVELIHSVFVQARIPMPPGTASSWKRFRELMFDKETIGGIRVRRPILAETPRSRTARPGRY